MLLSSREAARLLGVKPATLYSYVSRGWIRAFPGKRHRERRYARADLERLKARADARSGHGPVAAGALQWGEPVLDSAITELRQDGPWYRGHAALQLAQGKTFEQVRDLLWTGEMPPSPTPLPPLELGVSVPALRRLLRGDVPLLTFLLGCVPLLSAQDSERSSTTGGGELARGRALMRRLVALAGVRFGVEPESILAAPTLAGGLGMALLAKRGRAGVLAINEALIACADHELNVSTFCARVAASAGADLYACITAALATFTGPRHGAESDRVESLLHEMGRPQDARRTLLARAQRGEAIPGFGHPLYRSGDPRGRLLIDTARKLAPTLPRLQRVMALVDAAEELGMEGPTLDLGLVALSAALQLPPGAPSVIFCVGRLAGWIGHVREQRDSNVLLRPRARYVTPR